MNRLPPPRALSLDAAGTLMHVARPVGTTYSQIASRYGIRVAPRTVGTRFRHAFARMTPLAFPGLDARTRLQAERAWWRELVSRALGAATAAHPAFEPFFDALYAHYADPRAWRLYPETLPVLDALRERAVAVVVTSNFDRRLLGLLEALGVRERVRAVVYSSAAGAAKPDPRIFAITTAHLRTPAAAVLHVGDDAVADLRGAHTAGLQAALVRRQAHAAPADDALSDLHDALDFLVR